MPYPYAADFDAIDPNAALVRNFAPSGWNVWQFYSITVPVTSGTVTVGVNFYGAAGAWGDADDFYFGLAGADTDISAIQVKPVFVRFD
ncbi:hypothetical protein GE107_06335 [Cohnella sp. CFH 77786]|uniref:hypothetical protein n=1 Tax=Cohnella sp. CFH 77786 TaxID=2662265 RepID=UPI001C60BF2B|nr:hypothetical protein [Cohnella sp. CFH 77786]MBW5445682.1 hypothetical protein [Cohnella sp. CFH 77786]